jgi:porin
MGRYRQSGAAIARSNHDRAAGTGQKHADPWQPLIDRGIRLALNYTGEAAANPVGGDRQDAAYAGQVYMGVDLDMGKLAGIHGAGLHFAVTNRHGDNLAQTALGNNTSVQEIWGTQNTHLAILTWEQSFLNDHLTIEAGKSQANIHFLTSPLYCNFQSNSACGNPTLVFKDSNFTYFPASSWMAKARVHSTGTGSPMPGSMKSIPTASGRPTTVSA